MRYDRMLINGPYRKAVSNRTSCQKIDRNTLKNQRVPQGTGDRYGRRLSTFLPAVPYLTLSLGKYGGTTWGFATRGVADVAPVADR